jgi:hypothetical protein
LEVVAKTGRSETNGNAGSADMVGRPWEEVHKTLSDSMKERLDPFAVKCQFNRMKCVDASKSAGSSLAFLAELRLTTTLADPRVWSRLTCKTQALRFSQVID